MTGVPRSLRSLVGLRVLIGAALTTTPCARLGAVLHQPLDRRACVFARILGARCLIEAAALARSPTRRVVLLGAGVDVAHGLSMLVLAWLRPARIGLAFLNAASAAVFAIWGFRNARLTIASGVRPSNDANARGAG